MLQDRLPVKFQDVKFKDSKFKHEIFMRIDMKHSYFSNYFIFTVVEIVIELFVFKKSNSCLCIIFVLLLK